MDNSKSSEDEKKYFIAAAEGRVDEVQRLLSKGIPVDVPESGTGLYALYPALNGTALMFAANNRHLEVVRVLLRAGANASAVSKAHKHDGGGGSQPLHFAAGAGNTAIIEELLNAGANVNVQGNWGRTPLTVAVSRGAVDAVRFLLAHGADPNFKGSRNADKPPLYAAVVGEDISPALKKELVTILLKAGADPDGADELGSSPLMRLPGLSKIPEETVIELMELLLKAGAKADHADRHKETALERAIFWKNGKAAKLLLDKGATYNRVFRRGVPLEMVEKHVESLRKEFADPTLTEKRRPWVAKQLPEMEELLNALVKRGAKRKSELQ